MAQWPEFRLSFWFSVYRKAESYVAIFIPSVLVALVVDWDGGDFYAWVLLRISVVMFCVYLVDSNKSDDIYMHHLYKLAAVLGEERFATCKRIVAGDLQVELLPKQHQLTGCLALGTLRSAQQIRRAAELLNFMETFKLRAANTYPTETCASTTARTRRYLGTYFQWSGRQHVSGKQIWFPTAFSGALQFTISTYFSLTTNRSG